MSRWDGMHGKVFSSTNERRAGDPPTARVRVIKKQLPSSVRSSIEICGPPSSVARGTVLRVRRRKKAGEGGPTRYAPYTCMYVSTSARAAQSGF